MPRFFLHVRDGLDISCDREGQECANAQAARKEAVSAGREMLGDRLLHGGSLNHRQIEIADETGHVVDVVTMNDIVFHHGKMQTYDDDVTQSAPVITPSK